MIIEVSETSLPIDRGMKLRSYARARIVCYWIINQIDREIEVYMQPYSKADVPSYLDRQIFKPGDFIPLKIDSHTVGLIAVAGLLRV